MMTNVSLGEELLKSFDEFMDTELRQLSHPEGLYSPVHYIMRLGGKRIRPLSLLFVQHLLGGSKLAALHAAFGIELFHNFTLMHDDIMDEAFMRRSKPTVHNVYGTPSAILSGDVMLVEAIVHFRKAESIMASHGLGDMLLETARQVCEGQAMDMDFEKRTNVSLEEYTEMIRLKTAVLLAACLYSGAIVGQREDLAKPLYQIGIQMGICFQLEDDYLDYFAEDPGFGKVRAGDILRGKKSALILELADALEENDRKIFLQNYQGQTDPQKRLSMVEEWLIRFDTGNRLKNRIKNYKVNVSNMLNQMDVSDRVRLTLGEWSNNILERTF